MDHEFHSIVEKLAILEGRITPKEKVAEPKQKKPALFNNLKKKEESAIPMVGGVEFAEEKSEDVLSKVKASLADYLKSAEENIKQDKDLIAKKKEDLDLKKKELRDLELQTKAHEETDEAYDMDQLHKDAAAGIKSSMDRASDNRIAALKNPPKEKGFMAQVGDKIIGGVKGAAKGFMGGSGAVEEAIPDMLEEDQLQVGDPIIVTAPNAYEGMTGEIVEFSPSGKFVVVRLYNEDEECSMHVSDVEYNQYADDEDADEYGEYEHDEVDENSTYAQDSTSTYAQGGNNTYAKESAPVKTMNVELDEMGGSVLVEIHGDERDGFCIKRAGRELPTRFSSLQDAEMALEMFNARRKAMLKAEQSADYIEEKK